MADPLSSRSTTVGGQARSMVLSRRGLVTSESLFASQAGVEVLESGGNAVDAAVAANAVMGVVAPHSNGLGGDLFAIVYHAASDTYTGLNASGWSPARFTLETFAANNAKEMPRKGIGSVSVPGTVEGWGKLLERFGTQALARLLAPAIHLAEEGFPIAERSARRWQENQHELLGHAREIFLPGGRAPEVGEVVRTPELAQSLRLLANGGARAFYEGELADRLVRFSTSEGGVLTHADLADFHAEWIDPIQTSYRGWSVLELPPNGAGIAALTMLNILEQFPLADLPAGSPEALHLMIEAKKLAYADMLRYVCDPLHGKPPVDRILSKDYAAKRAALIHPKRAMEGAEPGQLLEEGGDTIYLCASDSEGNIVSLIQSNFMNFGSGLAAPGAGFLLQNRAHLFSLDPAHANVVAGRKRPLHTIIPAFLSRGEQRIAFGIQGGWNQAQAQAQFVSDVVDHGMNIQAAMEFPRFTKLSFAGADVQLESRFIPEVVASLERRGHHVSLEPPYSENMGGGQALLRDAATGVSFAASDPRKDGGAIPQLRCRSALHES